MKERFRHIAHQVSVIAGSPWVFILAVSIIVIWALTGWLFDFSNTWQLAINTTTTIITFLMVFLIQNTQNRDSQAMQLKLDELIRATRARDSFIDIEDLDDDELAMVTEEFRKMHEASNDPTLKKFRTKLEAVHQQRRKQPEGSVASHVASLLNKPISLHDDHRNNHKKS